MIFYFLLIIIDFINFLDKIKVAINPKKPIKDPI